VLTRCRDRFVRAAGLLLAAAALFIVPVQPAPAQNFFESLFGGGFRRPEPAPSMPPRVSSYADPISSRHTGSHPSGDYSYSGGGGVAFCVRTCDGRFFPLQRHASATPAELCKSFCPAAKTAVFHGSKIDHAVGPNGQRDADLDNAFVYRKQVVDNCTCNGKDAFGLVRMEVATDPTLKQGDIVATTDGLASVRSKGANTAEFTPIQPSKSDLGRRLSATKVTPVAPQPKVERVADDPAPKRKPQHAAR
jgi:hypothetical protein